MPSWGRRIVVPLLVASLVVAADQATKRAVVDWLGPGQGQPRFGILEPVLAVHYVQNSGAAFGVLRGHGVLVGAVGLLLLGGLVAYYAAARASSRWLTASVGLLVGGAIGNLIDRVRLGYVVDFVAVGAWPKFNVADSAVTVGVALLAISVLRDERATQPRRGMPRSPASSAGSLSLPPGAEGQG